MKFLQSIATIAVLALVGCKSAQPVATANSNAKADENAAQRQVIDGHYAIPRQFNTAYIKADVRYEDPKNKQNVSAEIRIKKDEIILVSVRLLGITMAKALITPQQVKYYEKLGANYFECDYAMLSKWLGTDLDFQKVQRMLIGQAMDDLRAGTYQMKTEGNRYVLESSGEVKCTFAIAPDDFHLQAQQLEQTAQARSLLVTYPGYRSYGSAVLPLQLLIEAMQPKGKTTIDVSFDSVELDQPLTFPYSVPSGYDRIELND